MLIPKYSIEISGFCIRRIGCYYTIGYCWFRCYSFV